MPVVGFCSTAISAKYQRLNENNQGLLFQMMSEALSRLLKARGQVGAFSQGMRLPAQTTERMRENTGLRGDDDSVFVGYHDVFFQHFTSLLCKIIYFD